ncbi:hypothetical protein F5X68DRAFT_233550 [Plectosphaerella plurivora]|uniref:Uncharacterized protein n=1 Tax=Plectosphaerella plurivora TaxID=936078 RepID=A0A9P9A8G3_9PEZI|nr:hypothetical protein F5X68DRAFT_233550 [Plectosphaerella plurivora]
MQPRLELVLPVQPLHLYRHLLREATYLPAICRPFVYSRIRGGFDRSTEAIATARRKIPPPTGLDDPKTKALHHGLRQLRGLRAVNLGDYKRLDRLLHHVFGRAGKRRRELLAPLLQPSAPRDSEELQKQLLEKQGAPLVDKLGRPLRMRRPDGWDRRRILTYVDSQRAQQKATSPTDWGRIGTQSAYSSKADDGRLPPLDAYGKPINERRKRKLLERWWKSAATKMAPPLEKTEWEKIKAAATGELPDNDWKFAPRRTIARSSKPPAETKWDWTSLASKSASLAGRPVIRQQWRLTGKQETGPYGFQRPQRDALPARTVQRAYERIWNTTSYIEQNPETLNSKAIHWGGERGLDLQLPVATAKEARIFGFGEAAESTAREGV